MSNHTKRAHMSSRQRAEYHRKRQLWLNTQLALNFCPEDALGLICLSGVRAECVCAKDCRPAAQRAADNPLCKDMPWACPADR